MDHSAALPARKVVRVKACVLAGVSIFKRRISDFELRISDAGGQVALAAKAHTGVRLVGQPKQAAEGIRNPKSEIRNPSGPPLIFFPQPTPPLSLPRQDSASPSDLHWGCPCSGPWQAGVTSASRTDALPGLRDRASRRADAGAPVSM